MTHSSAPRAAAGTLLCLLALVGAAPIATAWPNPGDVDSFTFGHRAMSCELQRSDTQLVRCDNLTGAGAAAPLFIPELPRLIQPTAR